MDRDRAALVLEEIARLLELQGEDRFRVRAFRTAARALERLEEDLGQVVRSGRLGEVRGIGAATARIITELVETGRASYHETLRERTPLGMRELLAVPGLGPGRVRTLHASLGIETLADLERALAEDRVAGLPGFGRRTAERVAGGIGFVRSGLGRRRLGPALEALERATGIVRALPHVVRAVGAGEGRRSLETVGELVVVAEADADRFQEIIAAFLDLPGMMRTRALAPDEAEALLSDGLALRLVLAIADAFATTCIEETGAASHVAQLRERARTLGLELTREGVGRGETRIPTRDEEEVYAALELEPVPPELREGTIEVVAAAEGWLPRLIVEGDLRGCFHCHTTYSDGKATIGELGEAARALGWRYLGIADHSQAASYAQGLSPEQVMRQHAEIDAWNARHGDVVRLFKGIEADIQADGGLDYEGSAPGLLERFDYVIGSVHSRFGLSREEMTRRIVRAVRNPRLTMLGHATGRLLLTRRPYDVDVNAVIDAAAESGAAVEINADPHRLDLDWRHWPRAKAAGVRCAINPDAHSVDGLRVLPLGVRMARKGWLEVKDVVNAWELEEVEVWLAGQKARAP